ncbi:MAG: hypothetical protein IT441_06150 [Phycisphaeraceae bacterium]|nr:hypothetical protein [Phycisphaeraceae bacterium]
MNSPSAHDDPLAEAGQDDLGLSTSTLGGEGTDALEADAGFEAKPPGRFLNQGTLLILMAILVAGGSLYAMRLSRGDLTKSNNTSVEAKIEQALAKLTRPEALRDKDPLRPDNLKSVFQDTDSVVNMFSSDPAERQVPVHLLKKNPFRLYNPQPNEADEGGDGRRAEQELARLRDKLARDYKKLTLNGINAGRIPIAIISGEMYRQGDKVGPFVIQSIRADDFAVTLESSGLIFTLRMETTRNEAGMSQGVLDSTQ